LPSFRRDSGPSGRASPPPPPPIYQKLALLFFHHHPRRLFSFTSRSLDTPCYNHHSRISISQPPPRCEGVWGWRCSFCKVWTALQRVIISPNPIPLWTVQVYPFPLPFESRVQLMPLFFSLVLSASISVEPPFPSVSLKNPRPCFMSKITPKLAGDEGFRPPYDCLQFHEPVSGSFCFLALALNLPSNSANLVSSSYSASPSIPAKSFFQVCPLLAQKTNLFPKLRADYASELFSDRTVPILDSGRCPLTSFFLFPFLNWLIFSVFPGL